MPPSRPEGGPGLKINLDKYPIFRPGDVISGHIIRKEHLVSPNTRVSVSLRGRAKVKIVINRNNNRAHYRARYNFFDSRQCPDTALQLFSGPLHIPPATQATENDWAVWPFSLKIPQYTHMSPNANHGEECFLDPHRRDDSGNVALDPLPSSFTKMDVGFSTQFDSYVEYSLEATLLSTGTSNRTHDMAVQPLTIRAIPPEGLVDARAKLLRKSLYHVIKTQRLEPGMAEAELGFRDKFAKTLKLGSVPSFGFKVELITPARVQLDARGTVPFLLKAVPQEKLAPEMSKKMLEEPPVATLSGLKMSIRSRTSVMAPGSFYAHTASGSDKIYVVFEGTIPKKVAPIELPVGERADALDVGALLGLRFGVDTSEVLGKEVKMHPKLVESFTTYCIEQRHSLIWEIEITIAQESEKFEGEVGFDLVAPPLEPPQSVEEVPLGGSRAAYENGLAPPPEEVTQEEQPPAYEKS